VPRETEAAILISVNAPRPAAVLRHLLDEHARSGSAITRPSSAGTPGAPVIVGHAVLAELRHISAADGLDSILARHAGQITDVAFADDVVLLRIEDAAGYRRALERIG
jgi:CTP:molybdopterin cytidylyltransferase MocA